MNLCQSSRETGNKPDPVRRSIALLLVALMITACGGPKISHDKPVATAAATATVAATATEVVELAGTLPIPTATLPPTDTAAPPTPTAAPPTPTAAPPVPTAAPGAPDEIAIVTNIVDGDTIDVQMDGETYRVRYIGMDTPEMDQACGTEAKQANDTLVAGQTVRMVKDVSETDRFGRLLRYVYVGDVFVNGALVAGGWAIAKDYPPDVAMSDLLHDLMLEGVGHGCELLPGAQTTPATGSRGPSSAALRIVNVNKRAEYVDILNESDADIDLNGWMLRSEKGSQDCYLGGVIGAGQTLRIWAMARDKDKGGFNCEFGSDIWSNSQPDPAVLFDPTGQEVSRFP